MKRYFTTGMALLMLAGFGRAEVYEAFEGDGFGNWVVEGEAFGMAPAVGGTGGIAFKGFSESSLACSTHGGTAAKGTLTSPEFTVGSDFIIFLVAGGDIEGKTAVQLLHNGKVVRESTGNRSLTLQESAMDVKPLRGQRVQLRLVDDADGEWGFIAVDHIQFENWPKPPFPPQAVEPAAQSAVASAVSGLNIPSGTRAMVVADHQEHGVYSPTALAFDEQGVLYLAETHRFRHGIEDNRNHVHWLLEDAAARTVDDRRRMYERWSDKVSPQYLTEKTEVIRSLAGRDDEGKYQRVKTFADGFNDALDGTAAGVFAYEGSVYFACIPKIYRLVDSDGNGVADERHVIADGMGVRVSFSGHDLNGFKLGPDGRIYCTIGDRGFNVTTADGVTYEYPDQGGVFRFDPDGSNFEVIHFGLRNPKELAFDVHGNLFSVDNNSDQGDKARLVYIVEGGDSGWRMGHQLMNSFHRQIGMEQRPPNMWMQEKWWEPGSDLHPASIVPPVANITSGPSGLAYHPGTGYRKEDVGRFFICDYRGSAANSGIWSFAVEPSGAGMKMTNAEFEITGVCATDVTFSWDGDLYISDFVVGWESHADGRVIQVSADEPHLAARAREVAQLVAKGFGKLSDDELEKLLDHPDQRVRNRATIALTRSDTGVDVLGKAAAGGKGLNRLHAVWGLGIIARRGAAVMPDGTSPAPDAARMKRAAETLIGLLEGADPEQRAQIAKVLGDAGVRDGVPYAKLVADKSPRVRMFAAIAAGKTGATDALPAVEMMLAGNADEDAWLRHAGAFALSKLASPDALAGYTSHKSAPVRLAAVVALGYLKQPGAGAFLKDSSSGVVDEAIRVIHDKYIEQDRPQVAALLDAPDAHPFTDFMWRRVVNSAFRAGGQDNAVRLVKAVLEPKLPMAVRTEAVRLLSLWQKPDPIDASTGTHAPLPERPRGEVAAALKGHVAELLHTDKVLLESVIRLIISSGADLAEVPVGELNAMMADTAVPAGARAGLLPAWVGLAGDKAQAVLTGLIDDPADELSFAAIDMLLKRESPGMVDVLVKQTNSDRASRARHAWRKLATFKDDIKVAATFTNAVFSLANTLGKDPAAIEILEGARARSDAMVTMALQQYDDKVASSGDPLAPHYPALLGGDHDRGRDDFRTHPAGQCMRCHMVGKRGSGDAGPNLKGIGKKLSREQLLEALVLPGARVAPGYGVVSITLHDGNITGGVLYEDDGTTVEIDVAGKRQRIARKDIASMTAPISSMPPMGLLLKPEEIRDIVEWLTVQ